ncbi:unnamed protein product [Musa acuminata var. zebrina]
MHKRKREGKSSHGLGKGVTLFLLILTVCVLLVVRFWLANREGWSLTRSRINPSSPIFVSQKMGLLEVSLPIDPVKQDVGTEESRLRLVRTRETRSSNLVHSPKTYRSLLQGSEAKFSQELIFSCSSTRSTSSDLSASPAHSFVTSALVYCVWESRMPYFLFVVDDDGGDVYVARPLKISPSVDKSLDYIYLFHSWKASRTASNKNVSNASHVVGKMKVSSSLIVNSRRSKFMEIEFVLFGSNEEYSKEKEKPLSNVKKSNGQSKKVVEMFRPSHSSMHNPKLKFGESGSRFEDPWQFFSNELQTIYESDCADQLTNGFPPNLELAAIVVGDQRYNSSKDVAFGGWGLKFLEKVELNDADFSQGVPSSSSKSCKEKSESDRKKTARNVTVLVPDGFHGGPVAEFGGPSNLIDRWKTNGHCDCGGWDAGCPIKVLNNESNSSKILPQAEMGEDHKSFELFIEGHKHGEPAFQLLNVSKDTYVVNVQPTLSALQSFSIGVAVIHSQTPDLYPNL